MSMHEFEHLDDAGKLRALADLLDPFGENHDITKLLLRSSNRIQQMDHVEFLLPKATNPSKAAGNELIPRSDKVNGNRNRRKSLVEYRTRSGLLKIGER